MREGNREYLGRMKDGCVREGNRECLGWMKDGCCEEGNREYLCRMREECEKEICQEIDISENWATLVNLLRVWRI